MGPNSFFGELFFGLGLVYMKKLLFNGFEKEIDT